MKAIIVTGDSGGLGSSICKAVAESTEATIIGMSRRENETVHDLRAELSDRYVHIEADFSNLDRLQDIFREKIYDNYQIAGLVNNSATAYDDLATNMRVEPLISMFTVNVYAPMLLSKLAIRNMLLHETAGSVVHISSVSVHTGYKGLSMYAATKGALEAYSKSLAREWGPRGIRSNCIAAGFMETAMTAGLDAAQRGKILMRNSMRSLLEANEVADGTAFLLSARASGITGSVLHVDKGTV